MTRIAIGCCSILFFFLGLVNSVSATSYDVNIYARVEGCGDALIQSGEQCDGTNVGGSTCESIGFSAGTLTCSTACTFITSSCTLNPPSTGSGGTRTSPISQNESNTNIVVFGEAVPLSTVSLLKDGQRVATVPVSASGTFQVTVAGLGSGAYRFVLVGEKAGFSPVRSEVFEVRILGGATTKVGPVILPAHVAFSQSKDIVTIRGYAPISKIIHIFSNGLKGESLVPDEDGYFETSVAATAGINLEVGVVLPDGMIVKSIPYEIKGFANPVIEQAYCILPGDINKDCKVGPVDFFISRFRYVQNLFSQRFDFNDDGKVTIVDFSIMAFYWTG